MLQVTFYEAFPFSAPKAALIFITQMATAFI